MIKKTAWSLFVMVVVVLLSSLVCVAEPVKKQEGNKDIVKIDINKASAEELAALDGIGKSYAERIVQYRQANGPFQKPEDIVKVQGVGPATYEKNKDRITVSAVKAAN